LELSEDLRCLAVARLGSNVIFGSQTVPLNNPLNGHPDALVYPLTCEEGLTSARLVLNEKLNELFSAHFSLERQLNETAPLGRRNY
jgi:hypothetical protein